MFSQEDSYAACLAALSRSAIFQCHWSLTKAEVGKFCVGSQAAAHHRTAFQNFCDESFRDESFRDEACQSEQVTANCPAVSPSKQRSKAKMRERQWGGTISAMTGLLSAGALHDFISPPTNSNVAYAATVAGCPLRGMPCAQRMA